MTDRLQSLLVAHGALIFLVGMIVGFPFAFHILGRIELWPIPGSIDIQIPGDYRGWRMAHLQGILNGLLLMGIGVLGSRLRLTDRAAQWLVRGLLVCGWGNMTASIIGPLAGARGLAFTGFEWNSLVFLLFAAAIAGIFVSMWLVFRGAWTRYRE